MYVIFTLSIILEYLFKRKKSRPTTDVVSQTTTHVLQLRMVEFFFCNYRVTGIWSWCRRPSGTLGILLSYWQKTQKCAKTILEWVKMCFDIIAVFNSTQSAPELLASFMKMGKYYFNLLPPLKTSVVKILAPTKRI